MFVRSKAEADVPADQIEKDRVLLRFLTREPWMEEADLAKIITLVDRQEFRIILPLGKEVESLYPWLHAYFFRECEDGGVR
jgi:hypothetical protein